MFWGYKMAMDDRVIKAALDSFENDDFLHAKELVQGQIRQAKNDFLKGKLELKNDLENQFIKVEPGSEMNIKTTNPLPDQKTEDEEEMDKEYEKIIQKPKSRKKKI